MSVFPFPRKLLFTWVYSVGFSDTTMAYLQLLKTGSWANYAIEEFSLA